MAGEQPEGRGERLDVVEAWGPYLSEEERAGIEEARWTPDAIKVWPLGPDGPCLTLREVAAWRAEQQRMAEALLQREEGDE